MSNDLSPPFRVYSMTLLANERRVVPHGRAVAFWLPVQGAGKAVPAQSLLVGFGEDSNMIPISEGVFISAPGDDGWKASVFQNSTASPITFDYVLTADPQALIIHGV